MLKLYKVTYRYISVTDGRNLSRDIKCVMLAEDPNHVKQTLALESSVYVLCRSLGAILTYDEPELLEGYELFRHGRSLNVPENGTTTHTT